MVPVVIEIIYRVLGLGLVKPQNLDTFLVVIDFNLVPYILPCCRVGRIKVCGGSLECHGNPLTAFSSDQVSLLKHLLVVLRLTVDREPH